MQTEEQRNDGIKKEKGNYGIRVARPGYDAGSCLDSQLLFNSSWPIMQVSKIIDFDKMGKEYFTYSTYSSGSIWPTQTTDVEPAGLGAKTMSPAENGKFRVGKKYCYKLLETGYAYDGSSNRWIVQKFKVVSHQLGFVPLWFKSEWVSNISGKIMLTSIDIQTDIDYPYDDTPTALVGKIRDYGISSSSIFGERVKGLDTGMFSKLVKRVMTTQKSGFIIYNDNEIIGKELTWYPVSNPNSLSEEEAKKYISQYECYSFTAGIYDTFAFTVEDSFEYRPVRVKMEYISDEEEPSGYRSYPIGFTTVSQAPDEYDKVLVILRSPMVSPEYEEASV